MDFDLNESHMHEGGVEVLDDLDLPVDDAIEVEPPTRPLPSYSRPGSPPQRLSFVADGSVPGSRRPSVMHGMQDFDARSDAGFRYDPAMGAAGMTRGRTLSPEEIERQKREILFHLERLERRGVPLPRKYTVAMPLEELRADYERIKEMRETELALQFYQNIVQTASTGLEMASGFLPGKYRPRLDGWSQNVAESLQQGTYDDVLEELHMKYRNKVKLPPELKFMGMFLGSAVMWHVTHSLMGSSSMPQMDDILRDNPALMKQIQEAAMRSAAQKNAGVGGIMNMLGNLGGMGGLGNLAGMFSQFTGGFGGGPMGGGRPSSPTSVDPPQQKREMRGPEDFEDLLRMMPTSIPAPMVGNARVTSPPASPKMASMRPRSPPSNPAPAAAPLDLSDENLDDILSEIDIHDIDARSAGSGPTAARRQNFLNRVQARKASKAAPTSITLDI